MIGKPLHIRWQGVGFDVLFAQSCWCYQSYIVKASSIRKQDPWLEMW